MKNKHSGHTFLNGDFLDSGASGTRILPAAVPSDPAQLKRILSAPFLGGPDEAWLSPLAFSLSEKPKNILTISLPHELFFRWYSSTGRDALEKHIRSVLGGTIDIRYEWPGYSLSPISSPPPSAESQRNLSFEDFILGGQNRESVLLLRRSLASPQGVILLHGPSGSGKSHLLSASFNELLSSLAGRAVLLPCQKLIEAFRTDPYTFSSLKSYAAVLVDDIHLLEHHHDIQRELIAFLDCVQNTCFIAAYQTDESDESGQKLLPALYDRLCSYLSLGLSSPDLDIRLRFAQAAMQRMGLPDHRETALFLARKCLRLRHILGLLEQIRLSYEQNGVLPSSSDLTSFLVRAGTPQTVDVDSILAVISSRYGCTTAELLGKNKDSRLNLPRQIAMYLCRELLGESYPSLGHIFGGKDHSTIMYSIRKIEKMRVTNKDTHIQLTELTKQCKNSIQRRDT